MTAVRAQSYRDHVASRYIAKRARGFTSLLWRARAQLEDSQTGEMIELRSEELARKLGELLARSDSGELPPLPIDTSPFARYESVTGQNEWLYLWRGEGALSDEPFARTKSADLARRAVDALNRANPRQLANASGPFKGGLVLVAGELTVG
jgi:hypothetical protein